MRKVVGIDGPLVIYGDAVPQGSMSSFGQEGVVTHSKREQLFTWRNAIRWELRRLIGPAFRDKLLTKPVAVRAIFYFARPESVPKSAVYKRTAPDLDKLCRAVGDALEGVLLKNDSLVVCWHPWKLYTDGNSRLELEVWELEQKDVPPIRRNQPQLALF